MTEIELQLVNLGRELDVPATPDIVAAVMRRIEPRRARRRGAWMLAVALALVAALGATLAIPQARSAFLRIFHIGGEEIQIVDQLPPLKPVATFDNGRRVSLADARRRVGFKVLVPEKKPDAVYVKDYATTGVLGGEVTLIYGSPERVRLLITERHADVDYRLAKKIASSGTRIEFVQVRGADGIFISGKPHFYLLVNPRGQIIEEEVRLAKDVLIWSDDGITYRIEGDLTLDKALELAESLR
jgi:hypothetical protein